MTPHLERVLQRLDRVRPSGNGWIARCPAHHDRNPSLSIREDGGNILLYCFAGCSVEAICEAIGITLSQLFAETRSSSRAAPSIVHTLERQLSASGFRSRLTPRERNRPVTIVVARHGTLEAAIDHALKLAVKGELVQIVLNEETR